MVCHKQESQERKEGDERKSRERERERERTYKKKEKEKGRRWEDQLPLSVTINSKYFSSFFDTSPWKMRMWKKVSSRRMRSGVILVESRRTGCVCVSQEEGMG